MKIQIENVIQNINDRSINGFNAIIHHSIKCKDNISLRDAILRDDNIQFLDFAIVWNRNHVAVHEVLPNRDGERLLLITKN